MEVVIDGERVRSEADLHEVLSQRLEFGPYYGENLAALRDRLSTDVERPVHLIWRSFDASRGVLGKELTHRIVEVFQSIVEEDQSLNLDERFTFSLE